MSRRFAASAFFLLGFSLSSCALGTGEKLLAIGGGEITAEMAARFVQWSQTSRSQILIITWANSDPAGCFEALKEKFGAHGATSISQAPDAPLLTDPGTKKSLLDQIGLATGIFFSGGDQNRILNVLEDKDIMAAIRNAYHSGVVIGGTSAGTAVLSGLAITGNGNEMVLDASQMQIREGLNLIPNVIFDQHFIRRQRQNRLTAQVLVHKVMGIGIDESTAVALSDNRKVEVIGLSQVMVFVPSTDRSRMRLDVLVPGEMYDLQLGKSS